MAEDNKNSEKNQGRLFKAIGFLLIISQVILGFFVLFHPKRLSKFLRKEKNEIKSLACGRESSLTFATKTCLLIKDFFIPDNTNGYKPKILRPKSLIAISTVAIILKVFITLVLFFTYPSSAEFSAIVSGNMIAQINKSRIENNLLPLRENLTLTSFACQKGLDMIARDYFAHDTPEGKRPWEFIDKSKYDYVYAGENLAVDFSTAEAVHTAFMKSPSHRRNILNQKYLDVGIAVLNGTMSGHKTILLVEFFGTQRKDIALLDGSQSPVKTIQTAVIPAPTKKVTAPQPAPKVSIPEVKKPVVIPKPTPTPVPAKTITLADKPAAVEQTLPNPKTAGAAEEEVLPNSISNEVLPEVPMAVNPEGAEIIKENMRQNTLADQILEYSNIFFLAFLIFMVISLGLNIFVRIHIQHPTVILQSFAVIALLIALLLIKFHFTEQIDTRLLIL